MTDPHVEGVVEHVQGAVEQLMVRMWRGVLGGRVLADIDYRSVLLEDQSLRFEVALGHRAWFERRDAWPKDVEYPYDDYRGPR